MYFNQIRKVSLSENEIKTAIVRSKEYNFIDNLRYRHKNISFDCKIRGFIGEIALIKWLNKNNININEEMINYKNDSDSMDVDIYYNGLNIELKTSLVPDIDRTINNVFKKRDIKLIRRTKKIEDLSGDIHIQIYFDHLRRKKDNWLSSQVVDLSSNDIDYLYDKLLCKSYKEKTYLFCWIDKETLVKRINSYDNFNQRIWSFPSSKRTFWKCPLNESFSIDKLLNVLT